VLFVPSPSLKGIKREGLPPLHGNPFGSGEAKGSQRRGKPLILCVHSFSCPCFSFAQTSAAIGRAKALPHGLEVG